MQDDENERIDRLEQRIAELERENAELRRDREGFRKALKQVIRDTVDTFDEIERRTEAGKVTLEQTLGRPFTDGKVIDQLARAG